MMVDTRGMETLLEFLMALLVALSTPCEYEDSYNCYWDAESRGNGEGRSFIVGAEVETEHSAEPAFIIWFDEGVR